MLALMAPHRPLADVSLEHRERELRVCFSEFLVAQQQLGVVLVMIAPGPQLGNPEL